MKDTGSGQPRLGMISREAKHRESDSALTAAQKNLPYLNIRGPVSPIAHRGYQRVPHSRLSGNIWGS